MNEKKPLIPAIVVEFAREIAIDIDDIDMLDDHDWHRLQLIECGLHSGYPRCCVSFFVTVWTLAADDTLSLDFEDDENFPDPSDFTPGQRIWWDYRGMVVEAEKKFGVKFGHVPCPACLLAGKIVESKPCECGLADSYPNLHTVEPGCVICE